MIDSQKKLKKYGNNKLWCKNKLISGNKFYNIFISIFLISIPSIIIISIQIKFYNKYSYKSLIPIIIISILYLISIFSSLRGGFTDPGILTRQNQDFYYNSNKNTIRYIINGNILNLNYCYSCSLFRPPRTSHCSVCDNCVERFDHHCIWLGNCIGKRNYKFFYFLILTVNLNAFFQVCYCIFLICFHGEKNRKKDKFDFIVIFSMSFVLFFDVCFILFFTGKLLLVHTYLIFKNLTFYEDIKKKWNKPPGINLLYKGICYSWNRVICFFSPKSTLSIFYFNDDNNNNFKNDIYENQVQSSLESDNKENVSKNQLRNVEDSIVRNKIIRYRNSSLNMGDTNNLIKRNDD